MSGMRTVLRRSIARLQRWSHSLHFRLMLTLLAVALAPLAALSVLNERAATAVLTERANEHLLGVALQTTASVDTFVKVNLNTVRTQAQLPGLSEYLSLPETERAGTPLESDVLRALRSFTRQNAVNIRAYSLFDRQGKVALDTAVPETGLDHAARDYFQKPRQTGLPYVSPVEFSPANGSASLYFSSPVRNASGDIVGVLRASYDANVLQQLILQNSSSSGQSIQLALLDENHIRLAHSNDPASIFQPVMPLDAEREAALLADWRLPPAARTERIEAWPSFERGLEQAGAQPYFSFSAGAGARDSEQAAAANLESMPWLVVVSESQGTLLAPVADARRSALTLAAAITLAVAVVSLAVAKVATGPLTRLTAVAGSVALGDLTAVARVESRDEIGVLAESFNHMTRQLRELVGALEHREKRFRALIEKSSEAVLLLNPQGMPLYMSPSTNRIFGGAEPTTGVEWMQRVHPDDLPQVSRFFSQLVAEPSASRSVEFRYRHRDGSWLWLEGVGTNLLAEPSVQAIVANIRPITERKQAEDEVRRQAAYAEALAHTAARLNAQLDLTAVERAICEECARAMNVPAAALHLYDPGADALRLAGSDGLPEAFGALTSWSRALHARLMTEEADLFISEDAQCLAPELNPGAEAGFGLCTVVSAIMRRGTHLIGALSIFTPGNARPFSADELALLRGLANQAAQAIVNARLFDQTERSVRRLEGLRAIDAAITSSTDLAPTLARVLEQVVEQLQVDAADILQYNVRTNMLEYAAGLGFRTSALQHTHLGLGRGYAGAAALEQRPIRVPDLGAAMGGLARAPFLPGEGFVSYHAVPLVAKAQIQGVLEVFQRSPLEPSEEWEEFLAALAGQAAIAIDNGQLFNNLQRSNLALRMAYDSTLEGWSRALDLRDEETEGHTERVTEMTLRLGRAMQLADEELVQIRRGALLHDIGKMGIPDRILLKPGPLSADEWLIMRKHPTYAYELLSPIAYLKPALDIPYCHHEKWDGSGYPRGLKGEQIPFAARMFALVDVWDALRSDRPYRAAWPEQKVREHIQSLAGTHFDPQLVPVFLKLLEERAAA